MYILCLQLLATQCLCEMTTYYSDKIVAKTKDDSYTDSEGRFVVTDKVHC